MKAFARMTAALGIAALCATAVFAQTPPAAPTMGKTHVKGYTRTMKNGKTVSVKGYNRMTNKPAMSHVNGYTRTMKSGKTVSVKGYNRKAPAKKGGMMKKIPL